MADANGDTPNPERPVIIVGAGPIGLACGIAAQERGIPAIIVEAGCIANSIYQYPLNMRFFSTPELLEIGDIPFITASEKPTRNDALVYYRKVAQVRDLDLRLYERVEDVSGSNGDFTVTTGKGTYRARAVIFAIGFFAEPRMLQVPGEDLPHVHHYYREPHPFASQRVVVIGSGNSSAEAALECYRAGAEVTLVLRSDDFHDGLKYWVRPDIENRLKHGEIASHFSTEVVEITPDAVVLERQGERFSVAADHVLALTGYIPNYGLLESAGVIIDDDPHRTPRHDESTYESNRAGIYLAGVVAGGLATNKWFIENSRHHADIIMDHIASRDFHRVS